MIIDLWVEKKKAKTTRDKFRLRRQISRLKRELSAELRQFVGVDNTDEVRNNVLSAAKRFIIRVNK